MAQSLGACLVSTKHETDELTDLVVKRRNSGVSWQKIADEAFAKGLIPKANPARMKRVHAKYLNKTLEAPNVKPPTSTLTVDPPVPAGQLIDAGDVGDLPSGLVDDIKHFNQEKTFTLPELHEAVDTYQDSGNFLNQALRAGEEVDSSLTRAIDEAIRIQQPLAKDVVVARGLLEITPQTHPDMFVVGARIQDKAFVSTSHDFSGVRDYVDELGGTFVQVRIPAGSKVLDIDAWRGASMGQMEVVLPRNSFFRVGKTPNGQWEFVLDNAPSPAVIPTPTPASVIPTPTATPTQTLEEFVQQGLTEGKSYKAIAEGAQQAGIITKSNPARIRRIAHKLQGDEIPRNSKALRKGAPPKGEFIAEKPRGIEKKVREWYKADIGKINDSSVRGRVKNQVVSEIAERWDVSAEELVRLIDFMRHSRNLSMQGRYVDALANGRLWIDNSRPTSAGYHRYLKLTISDGPPAGIWVRADSSEGLGLLKRSATDELIATWAQTSANAHVVALAMQQAAKQEFGLTRAISRIPDDMRSAVNDVINETGRPMQKFLRAMYDNTQEAFKKAGIEQVYVYRRMKFFREVPEWASAAQSTTSLARISDEDFLKLISDNSLLKQAADKGYIPRYDLSLGRLQEETITEMSRIISGKPIWQLSTEEARSIERRLRVEFSALLKSMPPPGTVIRDDVIFQPMSSFAIRPTLKMFGPYKVEGAVSVDRILGSARTGYGCLNEWEFIVLDTPGNMMVTYGK